MTRSRTTVVAVIAIAIVGIGALVYLNRPVQRVSLPPGTEFDPCVAKDGNKKCIDPVNACNAPIGMSYGPGNIPFGANDVAWCCPDGTDHVFTPPAKVKCVVPKTK